LEEIKWDKEYADTRAKINIWFEYSQLQTPSNTIQQKYLDMYAGIKRKTLRTLRNRYNIARLQNKNYIKKILAREQFLLLNSTQYKFTSSFVDNLKIDAVFTVTPFHRQEDILLRV